MVRFKQWIENLSGPGGGPELAPLDLQKYYKDITSRGAGAFPRFSENPPKQKNKSPTEDYLDPKHRKRFIKP